MDSSLDEDNENNEQVNVEECLEMNANIDLAIASAGCEEKLNTGKEIMDRLMHEWCSHVVMNLLLSQPMQHVMHIQWCLLGMHMYGKDFQERQVGGLEKEDVYVLDLEDSFVERVEKEHVMVLEDAMEVDAKFFAEENTCMGLGNEKHVRWDVNALMYMLLSVAT